MKILVTGGAGFIGSNLAIRLVNEGHEVTVIDSLSSQIHGTDPIKSSPLYKSICERVRFFHASVCDRSVWDKALPGQELVVHLAAETGTGQSMYEIHRYFDVNVNGTALMLDWLANNEHQVKRIVVASSRAIYGEGKYEEEDGSPIYPKSRRDEDLQRGTFELISERTGRPLKLVPTDEESRVQPSSVYGVTKFTQEQMIMSICPSLGIEPVALRYQNVYGPGQSLKNPYTGILSIFSTRILNGNPINIFEDGKESRDFVFIDDVVEATRLALFVPGAAAEVFGIGSGRATDVLKVAKTLVESYGKSVPITVSGAYRVGDIRHNLASTGKAHRILGFTAQTKFEEGMKCFADWVLKQEIEEDTYDISIREMAEKGLYKS